MARIARNLGHDATSLPDAKRDPNGKKWRFPAEVADWIEMPGPIPRTGLPSKEVQCGARERKRRRDHYGRH